MSTPDTYLNDTTKFGRSEQTKKDNNCVQKVRKRDEMTKIKFCGLTDITDILTVNELRPEYVGFVFWQKSKRFVPKEKASELKKALLPEIKAVGVFVDEAPEMIADLLADGVIDIAQLHGKENDEYIATLRELCKVDLPAPLIIKAFVIKEERDIEKAMKCSADYLLLDSGKGTGQTFNWELIKNAKFNKPFFLAGGLDPLNVEKAVRCLQPFAVDVSSGIETDGKKDPQKMKQFAKEVNQIFGR